MCSKKVLLLTTLISLLIISGVASAAVIEPNRFNYSEILGAGVPRNDTAIPVTNVSIIGFVCSSVNCATVNASLNLSDGTIISGTSNPPILNSGIFDIVNITYPTALNSPFGYGLYYYKEGYIPFEGNVTWHNTGIVPEYTNFISKMKSCTSAIENFTILNNVTPNMPLIIDVNATLGADTAAAISSAGPLSYVPPMLQEYYSVNTSVTLDIKNSTNDIISTNTTYLIINYSGSKHVSFTWIPNISGEYTASVTTNVPDPKCISSVPTAQAQMLTVWNESPRNACYTILNTLSTTPLLTERGQNITITFNKTSNYANDYLPDDLDYVLSPTATAVTYIIKNSSNVSVFSDSVILPANPGKYTPTKQNFSWTTTNTGRFNITVTGIANDTNCIGKNNTPETLLGTFDVVDTIPPVIIVQSPINGTTYTTASIRFSLIADEVLSSAWFSLDGTANQIMANSTGNWNFQNTAMINGFHNVTFYANDSAGIVNSTVPIVYFTVNVPPAPAVIASVSGSSSGGGSGGHYMTTTASNKYAYFSNVSIPDSIQAGKSFSIAGCLEKLVKNSSVDLYIDGKIKDTANITSKSKCFNISEKISEIGAHTIYLWFNESGADFSKSINVVSKEGTGISVLPTPPVVSGVKILDILAKEIIPLNVPVTINVPVKMAELSEVTVRLFANSTEIGLKQRTFKGTSTFAFNHTFNETGSIILWAIARAADGSENTLTKKIYVSDSMFAGLFLSESAKNTAIVLAILLVLFGAGYYVSKTSLFK